LLDEKKIRKDLAENVLSDNEVEYEYRATASKTKAIKKVLKMSFQLHFLFEN